MLTLSTGDVGVNHCLSCVEEVSELSLPDDECVGVVDADSVLKAQHPLLRQHTVGHLEDSTSEYTNTELNRYIQRTTHQNIPIQKIADKHNAQHIKIYQYRK